MPHDEGTDSGFNLLCVTVGLAIHRIQMQHDKTIKGLVSRIGSKKTWSVSNALGSEQQMKNADGSDRVRGCTREAAENPFCTPSVLRSHPVTPPWHNILELKYGYRVTALDKKWVERRHSLFEL
jgi:hypothetical protein